MTEAHFDGQRLTVTISENDMPEIPPIHWRLTVGGTEFQGVLALPPVKEEDGRLIYSIQMRALS